MNRHDAVILASVTVAVGFLLGLPTPPPAEAQFSWWTPTPTRTRTRTRTPTRTPSPPVPTVPPSPAPTAPGGPSPTPQPTSAATPPGPTATPSSSDVSADVFVCVANAYSRRLGPSAKVEVVTASGTWEIRPNPRGASFCWVTVAPPDRAPALGAAFTLRWTLGDSREEVDAGVIVPIRSTRGYYSPPARAIPAERSRIDVVAYPSPVPLNSAAVLVARRLTQQEHTP